MRHRLLATLLAATASGPAAAGEFIELDAPGGQATWISPDGRTVVGSIAGEGGGWVWRAETGAVVLSGSSSLAGLAGNGFPAGGSAPDPVSGLRQPAIWSAPDAQPLLLGGLPGATGLDGTLANTYGISGDAGTLVGLAYGDGTGAGNAHAFRWTAATGMTVLPKLTTERAARANGVSADGSVIWGWNDTSTGFRRGVRWTDGGIEELLDTAGGQVGEVSRGNSDGSILIGSRTTVPGRERDIWRWTAATGAVPLGHIAHGGPAGSSFAFGVTEDGGMIVGASGFGGNRIPTVWTQEDGLRPLAQLLAERGIEVPAGWSLNTATAVSADGRMIAGWGLSGNAFRSFLIDLGAPQGPAEVVVQAVGRVQFNSLTNTAYAGVPVDAPAVMNMTVVAPGEVAVAGQHLFHAIDPLRFELLVGTGIDTLVPNQFGPRLHVVNDNPVADGVYIFQTALTAGGAMEFEISQSAGTLFGSADLLDLQGAYGGGEFDNIDWNLFGQGGMSLRLDELRIERVCGLFCGGFD